MKPRGLPRTYISLSAIWVLIIMGVSIATWPRDGSAFFYDDLATWDGKAALSHRASVKTIMAQISERVVYFDDGYHIIIHPHDIGRVNLKSHVNDIHESAKEWDLDIPASQHIDHFFKSILGTSEQAFEHGTLGSLIRGGFDGSAELCIPRLCGEEEAHET